MSDHVFISYSHTDRVIVDQMVLQLQKSGFGVWRDHENLPVGTPNWDRSIRRGIITSVGVVLAASEAAATSSYVQHELLIAEDNSIPIYPLWVKGQKWSNCVPLGFARYQFSDGRANIITAVIEIARRIHNNRPIKSILVFSGTLGERMVKTGEQLEQWARGFSDVLFGAGYRVRVTQDETTEWDRQVVDKEDPSLVVLAINSVTESNLLQYFDPSFPVGITNSYATIRADFLTTLRSRRTVILAPERLRDDIERFKLDIPFVASSGVYTFGFDVKGEGALDAKNLTQWIETQQPT